MKRLTVTPPEQVHDSFLVEFEDVPDPDVVFHENVPGQPNGRLLHEKSWEHCPFCFVAALAELPGPEPVETGKVEDLLDSLLDTTMKKMGQALQDQMTKALFGVPSSMAGSLTEEQMRRFTNFTGRVPVSPPNVMNPTLKGVLSAAGYSEGPEPAPEEEAVDPETEEQDPALD